MTTISENNPFILALQQADQFIEQKNLQAAADLLNTLGRSEPNNPLVYMMGMKLGEAAGNPKVALQAARRTVECAPGWPNGLIELAACLARQNATEEALSVAQQAVDGAPTDLAILTRAVDIAHHSHHFAVGQPWLRLALAQNETNANLRRVLAHSLAQTNQLPEAIEVCTALLAEHPDDTTALAERMSAAFRSSDIAQARADADRLIALAPQDDTFRFWHDKLNGRVPTTQPPAMVVQLFDSYAPSFDMHLVRGLQYDTPKKVAQWIRSRYPTLELNILDLGCGTGLLGVFLGRINGFLIGVDLSTKMVEQAARHGVYDRFHTVNLVDALRETPADLYHVITANDVLIYVGDLTTVVPDAFRVCRPDGYFVFTCEQADESGPDLVLHDSIRYAHKVSAVQARCKAAGFDDVAIEFIDLRVERGAPIRGFRAIAHKPA
ncbi:methyltransferase domain-containing protein [Sphingomonas sp. NCPPB 2930]